MQRNEEGPRHRERGPGAEVLAGGRDNRHGTAAAPRIRDLDSAPIKLLAIALGSAYAGGPFQCPNRWCRSAKLPTWNHSQACFVQSPSLAHCYACGHDFTLWRLRRAVLEDPQLSRRLAREFEASVC